MRDGGVALDRLCDENGGDGQQRNQHRKADAKHGALFLAGLGIGVLGGVCTLGRRCSVVRLLGAFKRLRLTGLTGAFGRAGVSGFVGSVLRVAQLLRLGRFRGGGLSALRGGFGGGIRRGCCRFVRHGAVGF